MESNTGKGSWVCFDCNITLKTPSRSTGDFPFSKRVPRYFVHGIVFAVLFLLLEIFWIVSIVFLVMIGSFIGLIIGFAILFPIVGGINTVVSKLVWGFYMKSSLGDIFLHGFVLFIVLLIVDLVLLIPVMAYPGNLPITVVRFIVACFLYGLIGARLGEVWEE